MLHIVKPGEHLANIAERYHTSVEAIIQANVICHPDMIFAGEPLIIPQSNNPLPKAGGSPYYVTLFGDTIWCLSRQFNLSTDALMRVNHITNPYDLKPGTELLVSTDMPDPDELSDRWNAYGEQCEYINSLSAFEIFYKGEFKWEALGTAALPYLSPFIHHPCEIVRGSAVRSLGRLGAGENTRLLLQEALNDKELFIVQEAELALKRMDLVEKASSKRIHVTTHQQRLYTVPYTYSDSIILPEGTPIIAHRWYIPSPEGESIGPGALTVFDLVQVADTGQIGYLVRAGYGAIWLL